jgi:hypothetical protein
MIKNTSLVLSLPRSGSTVLTSMLARRADVLCLPESFFPGLLDWLTPEDWNDPEWMAALFCASCSDGSPLTIDEAMPCMEGGAERGLAALARRVAEKDGRDPDAIRAVVWKATRLVGSHRTTDSLGWKYVILKRPEINVFESQFRVPFGMKNRDPLRFALFAASYEAAFRSYPVERKKEVRYGDIPRDLGGILDWIGSSGVEEGQADSKVLARTAGTKPWHAAIGSEFRDDDAAKLANLDARLKGRFEKARRLIGILPILGGLARQRADRRQADALRNAAGELLEQRKA